jgi:hypothetical protein
MSLLDITASELGQLAPAVQAQVKALLNIRQGLFDILGAFPQDNVLPYFYSCINTTANGNAITASGTVNNSIRISADSAFIAVSIRGTSDGDFTAFMKQDGSDRQLMNIAVNSNAIMGTAERPGYLHKPLLLPANTTISLEFTDLSGATNQLWWTLAGFKVYNRKLG